MTNNSAFLLKDLVLLAVSVYLLKEDVKRIVTRNEGTAEPGRALQSS
jgi:hypothetical protein